MRAFRLHADQLSGCMLLALALYVLWENRTYPLGSLQEPGPGYTPLLIALFLGGVGLLIAFNGHKSALLSETRWPEAKRAIVILVACAAATYALERLGYRLTVIALLIFFLGVVEKKHPLRVAATAVGFSLLTFYLIGTVLRVPLPRGPWGF